MNYLASLWQKTGLGNKDLGFGFECREEALGTGRSIFSERMANLSPQLSALSPQPSTLNPQHLAPYAHLIPSPQLVAHLRHLKRIENIPYPGHQGFGFWDCGSAGFRRLCFRLVHVGCLIRRFRRAGMDVQGLMEVGSTRRKFRVLKGGGQFNTAVHQPCRRPPPQ